MIEKRKGLFCPVCDICGTELKWYDTFDEAVQAEKDAEWISKNINGEWCTICTDCQYLGEEEER